MARYVAAGFAARLSPSVDRRVQVTRPEVPQIVHPPPQMLLVDSSGSAGPLILRSGQKSLAGVRQTTVYYIVSLDCLFSSLQLSFPHREADFCGFQTPLFAC